jgi:hypothetical protein
MRLALRALADAAPSLRVEPEPEPAFGGDVEAEAAAPAGRPGSDSVAQTASPVAAREDDRPPTIVHRETVAPEAPAPPPLMPMPSIVPVTVARVDAPPPVAPAPERSESVVPADVARAPALGTSRDRPGGQAAPPLLRPQVSAQLRPPVGDLIAAPAAPAPPPRRDRPGSVLSGPPVEVTIGRVEIRVAPPAADRSERAQPAPAPPPALSLEEYLRRREASS